MRDQPRINGTSGEGMLTRIMRHSYKDAGRGPRREKAVDSPDDDVDIEKILEENRRLKEKIERLEKENRIFRKELEMKGLEIEAVLEKNRELECRVRMDSTNSSKPPSSDGYRKPSPRSRRVKSGLKRGGQPGHRGYNMPIPHAPDEVILHYPAKCQGCPRLEECSGTRLSCNGSRYVVDVVMATKVTEHRVLGAEDCPLDDSEGAVTGRFPDSVPAYVQYGDSVAAFGGLLSTYGAVSDMRISHLMRSMFGITLSAGTVPSLVSRCASKAAPALVAIRQRLVRSEVCHFDETGARTEGRLFWVHSSSNSEYTYQTISEKRGQTGMEENGVLPGFKGTAIHDCWAPYWRYDGASHGTCSAHFLRELTGIEDMGSGHKWPRLFQLLLYSMKSAKERALQEGRTALPIDALEAFDERFDRIMRLADRECPPPQPDNMTKGRMKRGKERSLIDRLRKHKNSVCLFVYDFKVPFDNNQAERDVRNVKTKIKVSGCFRSRNGGQDYLDVMSFLGSGRKHGIGAYQALLSAFNGNPEIVL